jgi:membrane-bound serine protease (ClpP class)
MRESTLVEHSTAPFRPVRAHARRRGALGLALIVAALALMLLGAPHSGAATTAAAAKAGFRGVDVVQVEGLLDPANESMLRGAIHDAERIGSTLLVVQLDSPGAVSVDPVSLAREIRRSTVPIAVWVGPSGARAHGGAAVVAEAAPLLSLASNAHIGPLRPLRLDHVGAKPVVPLPLDPARARAARRALTTHRLSAAAAKRAGAIDRIDPVLRSLLQGVDGMTIQTVAGPRTLHTIAIDPRSGAKVLNQDLRFRKLSLGGQLQHTLNAPWVAYFLFVAGGALIVFEFFTISIGLAGLTGALAIVGASYGFSHLPVRWWAIALLILSLIAFSVDVQAGGLGPWTVIALVSLVTGSIWLYGGSPQLRPAWWTILLVCLGVALFMIGAMTAMLRSRFATPTVGREGMVGELGVAEVPVAPDGVVRIRDALWRARTNRATPVRAGATVRVVAVEGLLLEVEPEEGGARDYRERRTRSPRPPTS